MKQGINWISRAIIESPYCIGLCLDEGNFQRELKKLKVPREHWPEWLPSDSAGAVHFFEKNDGHQKCAIVCTEKHGDPNETVGLLIHEAVHVWQHICEALDEDNPSREFEAYSIQAISLRLIAAYSELTAKPRKKKAAKVG